MVNYDVICIGDAKLDTFLTISDDNPKCRLDENTQELCVKHGEKISVERTYICVGGNAANVSIGLARLGINATIAAEIGDDEFSLKIINTLAKEGIDRGFIKQDHGTESSISVAIDYKNDRTLFSEHVKRDHKFSYDLATAKWVYLTSLGEEWTEAYQKALDYVKTNNAKLAFNPGTKQLAEKSEAVEKVLKVCDLLIINKQEAELLASEYGEKANSDEINEILSAVKKIGPKIVIATDGKNGSYVLNDENEYFHQDNFSCPIVELTGAGDGYSTGFLAATIHGAGIQDAMKWGTINSASVIGEIGAQKGLLRKEEMEVKINELR